MSFRAYLIIMAAATAAAWLAWIVVLVSIDPTRSGQLGFVFFYLTLSMALLGSLAIGGAGVRLWFRREVPVSRHVEKAFRQGVLLSGLLIGALLMLGFGFFRWWTITLLIGFAALMEMAFLSLQRNKRY